MGITWLNRREAAEQKRSLVTKGIVVGRHSSLEEDSDERHFGCRRDGLVRFCRSD